MFLGYLWNPLSWAMEAAALLAIILLDYADFCLIIALLLVNATIRCARPCSLQHQRASVPDTLPATLMGWPWHIVSGTVRLVLKPRAHPA